MRIIIENHIFKGDKGVRQLYGLLEAADAVDNKCAVLFNYCQFIKCKFNMNDFEKGSLKWEVVNWIAHQQVKGIQVV